MKRLCRGTIPLWPQTTTIHRTMTSSSAQESHKNSRGAAIVFSSSVVNHYARLGIDNEAALTISPEEIKIAYRKMALLTHPDVNSSGASQLSPSQRAAVETKFRLVSESYLILRDVARREELDDALGVSKARRQRLALDAATTPLRRPPREPKEQPFAKFKKSNSVPFNSPLREATQGIQAGFQQFYEDEENFSGPRPKKPFSAFTSDWVSPGTNSPPAADMSSELSKIIRNIQHDTKKYEYSEKEKENQEPPTNAQETNRKVDPNYSTAKMKTFTHLQEADQRENIHFGVRRKFLRKDADRAFKEAFDGKSYSEVLFKIKLVQMKKEASVGKKSSEESVDTNDKDSSANTTNVVPSYTRSIDFSFPSKSSYVNPNLVGVSALKQTPMYKMLAQKYKRSVQLFNHHQHNVTTEKDNQVVVTHDENNDRAIPNGGHIPFYPFSSKIPHGCTANMPTPLKHESPPTIQEISPLPVDEVSHFGAISSIVYPGTVPIDKTSVMSSANTMGIGLDGESVLSVGGNIVMDSNHFRSSNNHFFSYLTRGFGVGKPGEGVILSDQFVQSDVLGDGPNTPTAEKRALLHYLKEKRQDRINKESSGKLMSESDKKEEKKWEEEITKKACGGSKLMKYKTWNTPLRLNNLFVSRTVPFNIKCARDLMDPATRSEAWSRSKKYRQSGLQHNAGKLFSYQRPY
eukprot:Tbor_TRINITY_DN5489_c3_g1::TRINITY_DN5489_c3_g1_i1::g.24474::m.24474